MSDNKSIEKCFQILDLELTATFADVKEAHRFLVQTFHEDKYPRDSAMKTRAREKMIELNAAYEQLKKFFEEHPEGYANEGVSEGGVAGDGAGGGAADGYDCGDEPEMDWRTWQSRQTASADCAIKQWQQEEGQRLAKVKVEDEKTRRKHLVNFGIAAAWLVLLMMGTGHDATAFMHKYYDGVHVNDAGETFKYKCSMGTATRNDLNVLNQCKEQWNSDVDECGRSFLVIITMLAGLSYVTFFPKPRLHIANWIETGNLASPDLQKNLQPDAQA